MIGERQITSFAASWNDSTSSGNLLSSSFICAPLTMTSHLSRRATLKTEHCAPQLRYVS